MLELEGFRYVIYLDLTMGYYHILLCLYSWELKIGLCNSHDIFQDKMNELFNGLEYVRAYIDDVLMVSNNNFEDYLN